jgi:uncharacterized membrane protein YphA (DoxX/SURF4 family)
MTVALTVLLLLFLLQGVAKFALWRFAPYRVRIGRIAAYYARGQRIIRAYDTAALIAMAVLVVLLLLTGVEATSFATGLFVGMTLIQVFLHRFDQSLPNDRMPPEPLRPNQHTSYAIQHHPWLAWREITAITALSIWLGWALIAGSLID